MWGCSRVPMYLQKASSLCHANDMLGTSRAQDFSSSIIWPINKPSLDRNCLLLPATMAPPPSNLQTILIEIISQHAVLFAYNQPHISNAFTLQQYCDLRDALIWAKEEKDIEVIVVTGKGRHFCSGKVLSDPRSGGPTIEQEIAAGSSLGEVLQGYPKILIAAVHGAAIGWGCTQLWNFDLVYAHPEAFFQTPFMPLGFAPEGGSSWSFPKVMGKMRANRLLIAGERVSAEDMWVCGFVTEVLSDGVGAEGFIKRVKGIAERIGGYNAESLRLAKGLVSRPTEIGELREAGAREAAVLKVRLNDPETIGKIGAFQEGSLCGWSCQCLQWYRAESSSLVACEANLSFLNSRNPQAMALPPLATSDSRDPSMATLQPRRDSRALSTLATALSRNSLGVKASGYLCDAVASVLLDGGDLHNTAELLDITKKPSLTNLPGELKNRIYRLVLLRSHDDDINVTAPNYRRPSLLEVSRAIRNETIPIYYYENSFAIHLPDYSPALLMRWVRSLRRMGLEIDSNKPWGKKVFFKITVVDGKTGGKNPRPNWNNFQRHLKYMHQGLVPCFAMTPLDCWKESGDPGPVSDDTPSTFSSRLRREHADIERMTMVAMGRVDIKASDEIRSVPSNMGSLPSTTGAASPSANNHDNSVETTIESGSTQDTPAATSQSPFFRLSAELRNKIYRLALLQDSKIDMCAPSPGLLDVSRKIRSEALAIYYYENWFLCLLPDSDPALLVRWIKAMKKMGLETDNEAPVNNRVKHRIAFVDGQDPTKGSLPNWTNLLKHMKYIYDGDIPSPSLGPAEAYEQVRGRSTLAKRSRTVTKAAMGDLVKKTRKALSWEQVKELLEGQRAILAVTDELWVE
ncbi:hypothetical protein AC579_3314 [Pseudocercospora musae]|uniref:Uncharacterized protein n=1 Tax=Pseudocercospora musae TaxID=113226 RepID=A0A139I0L0_9PEZI|nr:hypothetical protein AC579_3314 [Pseudocercospora musae]